MKIGNITLPKTAALAPMASVADHAYRLMCKKYGAALVVGEMASSKGMFYSDRKTAELLAVTEEEYPMGVQLFGSEPDIMALACKKAAKFQPQFIDINMGCPVQKVVTTGSGSALMKTPQLAADIVKAVSYTHLDVYKRQGKAHFPSIYAGTRYMQALCQLRLR